MGACYVEYSICISSFVTKRLAKLLNLIYFFSANVQRQVQPPFQSVHEGKPAIFTCKTRVPISWKFQNKSLPEGIETGRIEQTIINWLFIPKVQMAHAGTYTCHAEDMRGIYESDAELEVRHRFMQPTDAEFEIFRKFMPPIVGKEEMASEQSERGTVRSIQSRVVILNYHSTYVIFTYDI